MSILGRPLGSHFPVGRIEINNNNNKNRWATHCFFVPFFWTFFWVVVDFFLAVVDLLSLACSPSLGSESFGLGCLFMSLGLDGWHLHLPRSFGGLEGAGFA